MLCEGTVVQIEKTLINGCLFVSKVSREFRIQTMYSFVVIDPWNLLFSKVVYFLIISIVFSLYKQNFTAQYLKN